MQGYYYYYYYSCLGNTASTYPWKEENDLMDFMN